MNKPLVQEWSAEDVSDLLLQVRGGSVAERRATVKSVNWARDDLRQLGWMMSQKDIDLATAVRVFLNGNPERFQYVGARNLPEESYARKLVMG